MPDQNTMALLTFALQVVNAMLVPAVFGVGRFVWRLDRRLYAIEVKLGMHGRASDS
jgi:hypothetical protein